MRSKMVFYLLKKLFYCSNGQVYSVLRRVIHSVALIIDFFDTSHFIHLQIRTFKQNKVNLSGANSHRPPNVLIYIASGIYNV